MKIIRKTHELQKILVLIKDKGQSIGSVLTMGNLHDGHLSLIKEAQLNNDFVVSDNERGKISILNSISYLKGKNEETDDSLQGIDPFKLVTGLRYDDANEKFNTELVATYHGKATLPDSDTFYNPDAYTIFDLIGSYDLSKDLTVDLGIYNLTDKRYYKYQNTRTVSKSYSTTERYSEPGRSIKAGFKFKF